MKKRFLTIIILLFLSIVSSFSQEPVNIIEASPTMSQFSRYDELPVSEYTGVPNISIPLFAIEEDGLSIPVNLSYHAGGLKVNQEASWVGLGWDLLSNFSIIQTVKDEDDIRTFYGPRGATLYPDWKTSSGGAIAAQMSYLDCWNNSVNGSIYTKYEAPPITKVFSYQISTLGYVPIEGTYMKKVGQIGALGLDDSEPDIFKVNIMGETITCIIDMKKNGIPYESKVPVVVLNKKGYLVSYSQANQWEITDPHGHRYLFKTNSEVNNLLMNRTYNIQNRIWYIDQIITNKGKQISFNYINAGKFIKKYKNGCKIILLSQESKNFHMPFNFGLRYGGHVGTKPSFNNYDCDTDIEETQYYLTSIIFPKGKIQFSSSGRTDIAGKKKLDNMLIYNLSNEKIKDIKFNYSYYSGEDSAARKLKLNSIITNNEETYSFNYDSQLLPSMNSYAIDYWGYYNGNKSNMSLAPNPLRWKNQNSYFRDLAIDNSRVRYNNKSSRLSYAQAGILQNIKYPTGGYVSFEYELNEFTNAWVPDYNSSTNTVSKGYGLRIKKIIFYNSDNSILKQEEYSYTGGKAISPLNFFQFINYKLSTNPPYSKSEGGLSLNCIRELKCSTYPCFYAENPLSSFSGVGYDCVIKKIKSTTDSIGCIKTYYNNTPDITGPMSLEVQEAFPNNLPAFKDSGKPTNGTPSKRIYYDVNGNKVVQEDFSYINKESKLYYGVNVGGYSPLIIDCFAGNTNLQIKQLTVYSRFLLGYYPIFDFESLLQKKTNTQYYGTDSVVYYETYTYNKNNLLASKMQTSSVFPKYFYYKYPNDYSDNIHKAMVSLNILSPVIENTFKRYNGTTMEIHKTNYKQENGYFLRQSEEMSYYDGGDTRTILTYDRYNKSGNLIEYTQMDGTKVLFIWSYGNNYPIAEIKNTTYNELTSKINILELETIADKLKPTSTDWQKINNLRTQLPHAYITTFEYKPLVGISKITDPSGIILTYNYDSFNRLLNITDNNDSIVEEYKYNYKP